jgi:hypothetical protein
MARPERRQAEALLEELEKRYLWWKPEDGGHHSADRVLAQAMNLGTYDDVLRIEAVFGADRLREVLAGAQPGWFSARSWEFWRGRLASTGRRELDPVPPRRSFGGGGP